MTAKALVLRRQRMTVAQAARRSWPGPCPPRPGAHTPRPWAASRVPTAKVPIDALDAGTVEEFTVQAWGEWAPATWNRLVPPLRRRGAGEMPVTVAVRDRRPRPHPPPAMIATPDPRWASLLGPSPATTHLPRRCGWR